MIALGMSDPAALLGVVQTDGQEAIRSVYRLAIQAVKARSRINDMAGQLDGRGYHAELARHPEAKYADELVAAKRRLDTLAQERRRLNVEAVQARERGRAESASIYELQVEAATGAMEAVARGVLLFLAMPQAPPQHTSPSTQPKAPTSSMEGGGV